jgi:ATP-dependent RNA helicase DHX29
VWTKTSLTPAVSLSNKPDEAPLLESTELPPEEQDPEPKPQPPPRPPAPADSAEPPSEPSSLFQSLDSAQSDAESDSDSELDLQRVNADWAVLMLELDNLRIAAGVGPGGKAKGGKKGKGNGVVLETPDMRRVKEKIGKMEKEYMFSRKDAGASRL